MPEITISGATVRLRRRWPVTASGSASATVPISRADSTTQADGSVAPARAVA